MLKIAAAGATALCAGILCTTPYSLSVTPQGSVSLSVDHAAALIGHPLTPMSVAGVHRRAMRRTYGVGANLGYHPVARAALYGTTIAGAGYYGAGYGGWGGYGYGAPSYAGLGWGGYGWGGWGWNRPGSLYSYSPVVSTTSQEATKSAAIDAEQQKYCLSRTFNLGPC